MWVWVPKKSVSSAYKTSASIGSFCFGVFSLVRMSVNIADIGSVNRNGDGAALSDLRLLRFVFRASIVHCDSELWIFIHICDQLKHIWGGLSAFEELVRVLVDFVESSFPIQ